MAQSLKKFLKGLYQKAQVDPLWSEFVTLEEEYEVVDDEKKQDIDEDVDEDEGSVHIQVETDDDNDDDDDDDEPSSETTSSLSIHASDEDMRMTDDDDDDDDVLRDLIHPDQTPKGDEIIINPDDEEYKDDTDALLLSNEIEDYIENDLDVEMSKPEYDLTNLVQIGESKEYIVAPLKKYFLDIVNDQNQVIGCFLPDEEPENDRMMYETWLNTFGIKHKMSHSGGVNADPRGFFIYHSKAELLRIYKDNLKK